MQLTQSNYYSPEASASYYSVSQIKQFLDCPDCAMAELRGDWVRPKTTALLVGGFVDAYFSCEMEQFCEANPEIFTKKGDLKSDFVKSMDVIRRIERDELAMMMLCGEKQKIVTGQISGYPFKAKLDVLLSGDQCREIAERFPNMGELLFEDGAIVDMKIVKDFEPMYKPEEGRMHFITYWRYDLQGAVYQELVRLLTGKRIPFYILAATKQDPPDVRLFRVDQADMDVQLDSLRRDLPDIDAIKKGKSIPERCDSCAWCRHSRVLTGAIGMELY